TRRSSDLSFGPDFSVPTSTSFVDFLIQPLFQLRPFGAFSPLRSVSMYLPPSACRQPVRVIDSAAAFVAVRLSAGCAASMSIAPRAATDAAVSLTFTLRPPGAPAGRGG